MTTTEGNSSVDMILEDERKAGQPDLKPSPPQAKSTNCPPIPILPDDDIDDGDDNFPLITSVFSLATSEGNDEVENPEVIKSSSKEVRSQDVGIKSPSNSPPENGSVSANSSRVNTKPTTTPAPQGNAPYFVGKGKLILPKNDESKSGKPPQGGGMTFSKMVSIHPITTSDATTTTSSGTQTSTQTSQRFTESSVKKSESDQTSHVTGSSTPASVATVTCDKGPIMINLSSTLPFLNVKLAKTQIAVPPMNTPPSTLSTSVLSLSSPLVQLIKRITPPTTTVTASHGTTLVKNAIAAPVVSSQKTILPIPTPKLQKPRHVNIAPAPVATISTARIVMLPQTVSNPVPKNQGVPTTQISNSVPRVVMVPKQTNPQSVSTSLPTKQVVSTTQMGNSVPRVVMVPKQANTSQVTVPTGQIMYLIENKTADGKTFRFLIPDNSKIVANNKITSPQTPAAALPPNSTSTAQLIKIIPKPLHVVTQVPKVTTSTTTTTGHASPLLNTGSKYSVAGNITPPISTSPTVNMMSFTSPISEQDSLNTPPVSPAPLEECPSSDDLLLDTGLSPHEARIQKLKELLKKQEDAVERLREKRKKEIEDIRGSPAITSSTDTNVGANKRSSSPFAVPLPPKKSRLDLNKRKLTETSTQTSKDGFLPNSDDQQFVKLVGLEKVVDKIKAKKLLELQENKVSN